MTYRWDGVSPEGWSGVGSVDARPSSGGVPGLWGPGWSVIGGQEARAVSWVSSSFSISQAVGGFEHDWQSDDALSHSFEHAGRACWIDTLWQELYLLLYENGTLNPNLQVLVVHLLLVHCTRAFFCSQF